MSNTINTTSNALAGSVNDTRKDVQQPTVVNCLTQPTTVEQPTPPAPVSCKQGQNVVAQVFPQVQQAEKRTVSFNDIHEKQPQKGKRTRHRLSQKEQHELVVCAMKHLKEGFSLKATAATLAVPEERLVSILIKSNLLGQINFLSNNVFHVEEVNQFLRDKFGVSLVDIKKKVKVSLLQNTKMILKEIIMNNYSLLPYPTEGYLQPMGTVYNPQLAAMANLNLEYAIQKKFVENNNESYDFQNLQKVIWDLGGVPITVFTLPCQNILIDFVNWQSPSFMNFKPIIHWLISETQLSEGMGLLSLLSTMFMTSRGKVKIKVKEGWQENASFYMLGISKSGTKKSVLIKRLRTPFEEYEQAQKKKISPELKRLAQQEIKRNQRQQIREVLKESINILDNLKQLTYEERHLKKELISEKVLASTITSTALLKILKENNEAINFLDPEPRLLLTLEKDPKLLELFLSGYTEGESFSYDTAYDNYSFDDPCINFFVMCQPNEAQKFIENKKLSDRGLLGRFLPVFSNQTGENFYVNNSQELAEFYKSKIQSLLKYFSQKEHVAEFSLTKEAQNFLQTIQFVNTQGIEPYNSFMAKGKGLIVCIATAIHLWDFKGDNDCFEISLAELFDAVTIVSTYVLPNVEFLYGRHSLKVYKTAYKILQRLSDISEPERYKIYNGILVSELKKMVHAKGTELDVPLKLLSMHNFIRVLKTQNGADKIILHPRFYLEFHNLAPLFPRLD